MADSVSAVRYIVKRLPDNEAGYSADMKEKERSEYGARLYAARVHAGLTQTVLAKMAGMSQSAYAEAETTGQKSMYTAQLAAACNVNPNWLATGEGSMLASEASDDLLAAVNTVARAIGKADQYKRISVAPLFAEMAKDPTQSGHIAQLVYLLLHSNPTEAAKPEDSPSRRRVVGLADSKSMGRAARHGQGSKDGKQGRK